MNSIQAISIIKEDWHDKPVRAEICIALINEIEQLSSSMTIKRLTFQMIAHLLKRDYEQIDLLTSLNYLAGERVHVLDKGFELFDEDDVPIEISPEEFAEAEESGVLINPSTGAVVDDFRKKVYLYFKPNLHHSS